MCCTLAENSIVVHQQRLVFRDVSAVERGEQGIAYGWVEEEYRNCCTQNARGMLVSAGKTFRYEIGQAGRQHCGNAYRKCASLQHSELQAALCRAYRPGTCHK